MAHKEKVKKREEGLTMEERKVLSPGEGQATRKLFPNETLDMIGKKRRRVPVEGEESLEQMIRNDK